MRRSSSVSTRERRAALTKEGGPGGRRKDIAYNATPSDKKTRTEEHRIRLAYGRPLRTEQKVSSASTGSRLREKAEIKKESGRVVLFHGQNDTR